MNDIEAKINSRLQEIDGLFGERNKPLVIYEENVTKMISGGDLLKKQTPVDTKVN